MNVVDNASRDVSTHGGGEIPPCTGFAPDALPEVQTPSLAENSQTGVSTRNALSGTCSEVTNERKTTISKWYALRTTYGRERKAYEYLSSKKVEAFYPTIRTVKVIDGKRKTVEESRIPNVFFARGTEDELKAFVYDNVNLPYLRFYYRHYHEGMQINKEPLIIPDRQIESLRIICESEAKDVIYSVGRIGKFLSGEMVRVIDGDFKGVVGRVARHQGQQRVGIIIDSLGTIMTAYVPSAFLLRL